MKQVLVFSCIILVAYAAIDSDPWQKWKAHLAKVYNDCETEIGVDKDDMAPINRRDTPTTTKGKCYLACAYEKLGFFDSDGKLNSKGIHAHLEKIRENDEKLYQIMIQRADKCLGSVKHHDDKCETAAEFFKCAESREGD